MLPPFDRDHSSFGRDEPIVRIDAIELSAGDFGLVTQPLDLLLLSLACFLLECYLISIPYVGAQLLPDLKKNFPSLNLQVPTCEAPDELRKQRIEVVTLTLS